MRQAARRIAMVALTLALVLFVAPQQSTGASPYCGAGESPQFRFGFAHLKELLGPTMGTPIECEHANPDNGDTLQQTSTGLSFYRKATNTPTFTNGWEHWAWTFQGLVYWTGSDIDPPGTATAAAPVETTPTTTSIAADAPVLSVAEVAAANRGAIVRVDMAASCGSGFFVSAEGYIVTNEHVVTTSNDVSIRLDGGQTIPGTVIARDANHDIALIKVAPGAYTTVQIGSSADVGLAASLIVMGYPLCTDSVTATQGILSSRVTVDGLDYIQTDATVNPGNSGGAAFDTRGALVGIPNWKIVLEGVENTNFLVPMNRVRSAFDSWIEQHRAGTLGATTAPVEAPPAGADLVYERDSLFCGLDGVIGWVEPVPIHQAANFTLRFDVHDLNPAIGLAGMFLGAIVEDDMRYLVLTGGFSRGTGGPYDMSFMRWDDATGWSAQDLYTGLVPPAPYTVQVTVIYPTASVTINGQLAAEFDGLIAMGRTLGMACTVFTGEATASITFRNISVWAYQ
jgi:S1-C subfamily serine protease